MTKSEIEYQCGSCGKVMSLQDMVCPYCGSTKKIITRKIRVEIHSGLNTKVRENGKTTGTWVSESIQRDVIEKSTGQTIRESRSIDRVRDKYMHRIVRRDGEVLHYEVEPLSNHREKKRVKKN